MYGLSASGRFRYINTIAMRLPATGGSIERSGRFAGKCLPHLCLWILLEVTCSVTAPPPEITASARKPSSFHW